MTFKKTASTKQSTEDTSAKVLLLGGWVGEPVAGIQVDQQIFAELGIPTLSVITELTSQGFAAVGNSYPVHPDYFSDMLGQADPGKAERQQHAPFVKVGLLRDPQQMDRLASWLKQRQARVILDPIMESSRGLKFHDESSRMYLRETLLPLCSLMTPNVAELSWLVGKPLSGFSSYIEAAGELLALGVKYVLITGCQQNQTQATDLLISANTILKLWTPLWPASMRGSGCRLASYITAACFQRREDFSLISDGPVKVWEEAVIQAKTWMARDFRRLQNPSSTTKNPLPLDFPRAQELQGGFQPLAWQEREQVDSNFVFQARDNLVRINGLYAIADSAEKLRIAFAAGARLGQLRGKSLGPAQLREQAQQAMAWATEYRATLILNDDLELAEAVGAWAVHLGQEDLERYGRRRLIQRKVGLGISTHSLKELAIAVDYLPDYIALGPIFPTTCKSMAFGPQGLEKISTWAELAGVPLVAIGGMTPETGLVAKNLGASAIAVISDLFHHPDGIPLRVQKWLESLAKTSTVLRQL